MANELEVVKGAKLAKQLTILDENDDPITTYTGSATLAAQCWRGDDQASLFSPTVAWISAAAGTISLTISAAQSATLTPGIYDLLLSITAGAADPVKRPIGVLRVLPAPGSAAARPVYCTWDETKRLAGSWAEKLQRIDTDQTGFAEERADARQEFEEKLHAAWRPDSLLSRQDTLDDLYFPSSRLTQLKDAWLVEALADDQLLVTSRIRDWCGYHTLTLICQRQINPANEDGYTAAATYYASKAESLAAMIVAEIDTDGDGQGDIPIRLNAMRVVRT